MDSVNDWTAYGFGDEMSIAKKDKKKAKKSDRSDSTAKKKKKSKRSSSKDDDDDLESFADIGLFAKAIAQAHREDNYALSEAFQDMHEDQEFVKAFDSNSNFDAVKADFGIRPQEQALVKPPVPEASGDDGEWFVDSNSKGAEMKEYARRLSIHSAQSTRSKERESRGQPSGQARAISKTQSKADVSEGTSQARNVSFENGNLTSRTITTVDFSNDQFHEAHATSTVQFNDSATIRSELTGLTGVFSSMTSNHGDFDDDSDSSSSTDEDEEVLDYPIYNPATKRPVMTQSANEKRTTKPKGKVQFGSVTVRGYQRIIGDNPSCKTGAPISIGWTVESETRHPTPEAHDLARGRAIRTSYELILPREVRHDMLLKLGYTEREIAQAVRTVLRDKNKRRTTVNNLSAEVVEEKLETVTSGMKKILFLRKR
ncbi:hypothetical protein MHU86_16949 [Fragilaria crotonensis]|nr:hypothetical protein MHU86_16949 [Fragilaria crotonensis]